MIGRNTEIDEFHALVQAINEKFRRDFHLILADRHLLFHTVKELLSFEKHMRAIHAYPVKEDGSGEYVPSSPDLPTCLDVLEDDGVFDIWLHAEIECMYNFAISLQAETVLDRV